MKIEEPQIIGFKKEMEIWRRKKPDNPHIETIVEKGILKYIEDTRKKTAIAVRKTINHGINGKISIPRHISSPYDDTRPEYSDNSFNGSATDSSTEYAAASDSVAGIIINEARGFDLAKEVIAKRLAGSERLVRPITKKGNSFYYEFIDMIDGYSGTLASMLPGMSASEAYGQFSNGLCGLAALHAQKIQHGDFKPHQILLGEKGAKLGDYTYTRRSEDEVLGFENREVLTGTPIFLSASHYLYGEWWQNDVYAIGASLRYMHDASFKEMGMGPLMKNPRLIPVRFNDSRDTNIEFLYNKLINIRESNLTAGFACNALRLAILKKPVMCFLDKLT